MPDTYQPMDYGTPAEQQAAAEKSLTELGLDAPAAWTGEPRTHQPARLNTYGARDRDVLSSQDVADIVTESVDTVEKLAMRKAALILAGTEPAVADALVTADTFPGALVTRMQDAIRPLRAQVQSELKLAKEFAKGGSPTDTLAGAAERRVAKLREILGTLDDLDGASYLTPSTLAQRLQAVEDLRARVAADKAE